MRARLHSTLMLLLAAGCQASPDAREAQAVRAIVVLQLQRHPQMGPSDLYKLLHQAAMGSEHAMSDSTGVRAWMTDELATMGAGPSEPMIDTIAPGGAIVRVYLRPWVAAGRSTDSLLGSFIATATAYPPDTARLARYLGDAEPVVSGGRFPFTLEAWRTYVARERGQGFPAVEHSPGYAAAYRPAYRVIAGRLIP